MRISAAESKKSYTSLFWASSLKNNNLSEAAAAPVPTPLPHSQEYRERESSPWCSFLCTYTQSVFSSTLSIINGISILIIIILGGLIPGSLTPPDKIVNDLSGHLIGQHHQQQQQQQQHHHHHQQQQQQHHNPYALALPNHGGQSGTSGSMAPTLQTPPSPLSTPSPPVPLDRFGCVLLTSWLENL